MKYNKLKRYFLMLIVFSMLTSCFCFKAAAAEIDIYETEPNDTLLVPDITEDLADNYGKISSASDVDYYKIIFDRGGKVNFWLGNIPSGCDYQMEIFKDGLPVKTINNNSNGTSEFAQHNVIADTVYYIKISSNSGYNASSYYLFSTRRNNLGEARFFTYDCQDIDTRESAEDSMPVLWKAGFSGQEYLNNGATPVYNSLKLCNIMVIHNHGAPGYMECATSSNTTTYLYANKNVTGTSNKSLLDLTTSDVSNLKLLVFLGCNTGQTGTTGNLVNIAYNKGVDCTFGWNGVIWIADNTKWITHFFQRCSYGTSFLYAQLDADEYMSRNGAVDIDTIKDRRTLATSAGLGFYS